MQRNPHRHRQVERINRVAVRDADARAQAPVGVGQAAALAAEDQRERRVECHLI